MYYFDRCSSELAELVLIIVECRLRLLLDCVIDVHLVLIIVECRLRLLLDCVIMSPYGCLCQQFLSSDS